MVFGTLQWFLVREQGAHPHIHHHFGSFLCRYRMFVVFIRVPFYGIGFEDIRATSVRKIIFLGSPLAL